MVKVKHHKVEVETNGIPAILKKADFSALIGTAPLKAKVSQAIKQGKPYDPSMVDSYSFGSAPRFNIGNDSGTIPVGRYQTGFADKSLKRFVEKHPSRSHRQITDVAHYKKAPDKKQVVAQVKKDVAALFAGTNFDSITRGDVFGDDIRKSFSKLTRPVDPDASYGFGTGRSFQPSGNMETIKTSDWSDFLVENRKSSSKPQKTMHQDAPKIAKRKTVAPRIPKTPSFALKELEKSNAKPGPAISLSYGGAFGPFADQVFYNPVKS